jgi:hypothetical protein
MCNLILYVYDVQVIRNTREFGEAGLADSHQTLDHVLHSLVDLFCLCCIALFGYRYSLVQD